MLCLFLITVGAIAVRKRCGVTADSLVAIAIAREDPRANSAGAGITIYINSSVICGHYHDYDLKPTTR
jgi:hypothetical protein